MEILELLVELRDELGKGAARRLRRAGKVPAILYGPKREPLALAVPTREFRQKVAALEGAHLIRLVNENLKVVNENLKECVAVVRDMQLHPVSSAILHVDFYEVDLAAKLTVSAPLHFVGKAAGVALGGILQPLRREIEVRCLPMQIPEHVEVDVSHLGIHDTIHVSELRLPEGVEVVYTEDFPVVTVLPPTVEEVSGAQMVGEAQAAAPGGEPAKGGTEK
ncbi:MAG: 50S ribosomal protein L25/general stress protein Ctc [Candidatus Binatia bacterium]|nr:50S ribosomal protein L25/general stress protein Ctc [Candidatus Binatia bacterium]